ncbi:MAG: hypothetical protein ACKO5C_00530 [Ferruginibacter sp.]
MIVKYRTIVLNYVLVPVLVGLFIYAAYSQLMEQPNLERGLLHIAKAGYHPMLYVVALLGFLNWSMETYKWKWLTKALESHTFGYLFCSVMSGCSVSMILPNRSGEFAGRILWMKPENRIAAASASFAGSIAQWMITILMGLLGLIVLRTELYQRLPEWFSGYGYYTVMLLAGIGLMIAFTVYWNFSWLEKRISSYAFFQKRQSVGLFLRSCSSKNLLIVLGWSLIRYGVFILQYLICLDVCGVYGNPLSMVCLIAVFFLLMSVSPAIGLVDLPLRATVGTLLIGITSSNIVGIQAAMVLIWLLNLAVPSLVGLLVNGRFLTKMQKT